VVAGEANQGRGVGATYIKGEGLWIGHSRAALEVLPHAIAPSPQVPDGEVFQVAHVKLPMGRQATRWLRLGPQALKMHAYAAI
jgi:hypothetical protein